MNWKNLANYNYLGAYSFVNTEEITLTIQGIKQEEVTTEGGKKDLCIIFDFKENKIGDVVVKPMVVNKTNCKIIESNFGTGEIEEWVGKQIVVYKTTTKFGRDTVDCLRVRKNEKTKKSFSTTFEPKKVEPAKEAQYHCVQCGSIIEKKIYDATIKKYGVSLCSKECAERYIAEQANENEEGEK